MSQPVKLSDALILDARLAGEVHQRSIAGQVEFWAGLGRSVDMLLAGRQVLALRRNAAAVPLSEALASVETPVGRKRVEEVLAHRPYPHYKQCPGKPRLLIRIDEDGKQTIGRFVNREFRVVENMDTESVSQPPKPQRRKMLLRAKTALSQSRGGSGRKPKERKTWS
jgi:hypothetical protein